MAINTLCVAVLWFSNTLVYYGLIESTPDFVDHGFYLIAFVGSAIEVPSVLITAILMYKLVHVVSVGHVVIFVSYGFIQSRTSLSFNRVSSHLRNLLHPCYYCTGCFKR